MGTRFLKRAPLWILLAGAGMLSLTGADVYGQVPQADNQQCVCQPQPGCCAPSRVPPVCVPPAPLPPAKPPDAAPERSSPQETSPTATESAPDFAAARAPAGVGETVAFAAMYGDQFGGPPTRLIIPRPALVIPGRPAFATTIGGPIVSGSNPVLFNQVFNTNNSSFVASQAFARFNSTFPAGFAYLAGNINPNNTIGVLESLAERQAALQFATSRFGSGGTLTYIPGSSFATALTQSAAQFTLQTNYDYFIPAVPNTVMPQSSILLSIPSPTGGGVVGRTKLSDDNSPLPRDRVIFSYDYFDNVPLTAAGVGVHRFSPGLEKTFFDRQASIEVRVPFASTLSSDIQADGAASNDVEFGNVNVTLKGLLYESAGFHVAAGLGVSIPTANDTVVLLPDGTEAIRIKNDAWVLTPYFAYLATPDDRWFFQNWFQFPFETAGNRVQINPGLGVADGGGRLRDQSLVQIDAQLGYWLYRNERQEARLRGLAPFVELHWNSTLDQGNTVQVGDLIIDAANNHLDELNLSAGVIAQFGDNINLVLGAVVPLKGGTNRSFDYQIGLHANIFFGPTARSQTAATAVSGF